MGDNTTPVTIWDDDAAKLAITKQLASKMTGFGFPNDPRSAALVGVRPLSSAVFVVEFSGVAEGAPVHALVVRKDHKPVAAWHVVDFRVGADIYGPGQ